MLRAAMLSREPVSGSRHKYRTMFERVPNLRVEWGRFTLEQLRDFDFAIVEGDKCRDYKLAMMAGIPYLLVEQDVASWRYAATSMKDEREMIESATAILLTAEPMLDYIGTLYDIPYCDIVHLRPLLSEVSFEPLPKLRGKHLVYAGGIVAREQASGAYGYRAYFDIFAAIQRAGWTVHVYPAWNGADRLGDYAAMGCVVHDELPQGDLYRELSQYTVGFQGYAETGPQSYIGGCRPNKLWESLGAGIPTLGYNTGSGREVYEGKWGLVAESMDDIAPTLAKLERMRSAKRDYLLSERLEQVIDNDLEKFVRLVDLLGAAARFAKRGTLRLSPKEMGRLVDGQAPQRQRVGRPPSGRTAPC